MFKTNSTVEEIFENLSFKVMIDHRGVRAPLPRGKGLQWAYRNTEGREYLKNYVRQHPN